jgi:hypothetical protein
LRQLLQLLRLPAATCGYLRLPAATCGYLRLPAATCGYLRLPAATCGYLQPRQLLLLLLTRPNIEIALQNSCLCLKNLLMLRANHSIFKSGSTRSRDPDVCQCFLLRLCFRFEMFHVYLLCIIVQEDRCGPMLDQLWKPSCTCRRCTASACSHSLSREMKIIQHSDTDWSRVIPSSVPSSLKPHFWVHDLNGILRPGNVTE